jgi:hypothetical protein
MQPRSEGFARPRELLGKAARSSVDYQHGRVHSSGAEPV